MWGNLDTITPYCQCYVGRTRLQCTKAFFFLLSLNSNSLSRSDNLKGRSKNSGKESLSSIQKRCSGQGTPWCHPKAGEATSWPALRLQRRLSQTPPAMSVVNNQISYTSFMVSMAWQWRSPLASSAPVLPLGRIYLDSRDDQ
jgi:hypothetical protein